ncbi:MAG: amino acid adenylation domain protein [Gammaproteobacteria bacterium]|jgi:amino acid adenylation domain-containing protein|nr:amino acid adenylation domain protein [Gammaproteobacteria bacterium]
MKADIKPRFDHLNVYANFTIAQLFEQQVEKQGSQIAITNLDNLSLTYEELNAKANKLAHYLRERGVERNTLVALYMERSIEFVIGMLAIIKAGGAYLPIDINACINRNKKILRDGKPIVILTKDETHAALKEEENFIQDRLLEVTSFFQAPKGENSLNLPCINRENDLSYVIYTSGSTGEPKGCMIPHRGVIRLVKNTNYIQINPTDRFAQMANCAFDAMTFEVWGALLNGASLCVIPHLVILSPVELAAAFQAQKISIAFITTALLNLCVRNYPAVFDGMTHLLFGGEKANPEVIENLLKRRAEYHLSNLKITHVYGPTECTTFALSFALQDRSDLEDENVPIGEPISHTTAYILDENLQLTMPGQVGELYLGGVGVALGYLNNPDLTAAKFIKAPVAEDKFLYKTGDLVFWKSGVGIIFVGRQDEQVKIRGIRVELTEIEACILKYEAVNQVIVKMQHDEQLGNYLVAYVEFFSKITVDYFSFHDFIKQNLPHYMLPQKIIQIENMPITPNGKTDKKKLSENQGKDISYGVLYKNQVNDHENPSTDQIEKIIANILENKLNIHITNRNCNIFDLGATSLMVADLCSKLNSKLGNIKKISILDIFTYPVIHTLAKYISLAQNNSTALNEKINLANHQRSVIAKRKLHDNFG